MFNSLQPDEKTRREQYEIHRKRVNNAKAVINHSSPIVNASNLVKFSKYKEDVHTYLLRYKANMRLLVNINRINRTIGIVDTFRTRWFHRRSSMTAKKEYRDFLEKRNMEFGKLLLRTKAEVNSFSTEPLRRRNKPVVPAFKPSAEILKKYNNKVTIPTDPLRLRRLFRPKIWFKLETKGYRPLGEVVVQLYTEAAPQIVLELMHICFYKNVDNIRFVRLFSGLWADCYLTLRNKTLVNKNIEYDMRVLDHEKYSGVFSFSLTMNTFVLTRGEFNFSISFKPLKVLNGKRVAFGHVIRGIKTLNCLQDYSTKNGKPTKEIVITNCGIY